MAKYLLAVALFTMAGSPLHGQDLRVQVNESIEKGVDFLLSRQLIDGSWGGWVNRSVYPTGVAPLVVYTLLKCGLPSDHPAIVRAFAWMESRPPLRVYNAGFLLLALEAAQDSEKVPWMEETAGDLLSWMPESGLFDYPGQYEDLSNTLIAGLGLDACEKAGIRIPSKYWKRLYTGTLTCITPVESYWDENGAEIHRRGFSYRPGATTCGSMTAAGISLLEICAKNLGEGLASRHRKTMKRIQEDSLRWLGDFFALSGNPPNRSWGSFNLWGYERVGALMEIDRIGDHDAFAVTDSDGASIDGGADCSMALDDDDESPTFGTVRAVNYRVFSEYFEGRTDLDEAGKESARQDLQDLCCEPVAHLCGIPLCPLAAPPTHPDAQVRAGITSVEGGVPNCVPFEIPDFCCPGIP